MNNFKVITYYTSKYAHMVDGWVENVSSFDYDYHIEEMPDENDWRLNVLNKPAYIADKMEQFRDVDLLWLDMDGVIIKPLTLIDEISASGYDMASRRMGKREQVSRPSFRKFKNRNFWMDKTMCSATMWFANNEKTHGLLRHAEKMVNDDPDRWHSNEDNMNCALYDKADELRLKYYDLPVTYCYITCLDNYRLCPEFKCKLADAVILQDVISKDMKRAYRNG